MDRMQEILRARLITLTGSIKGEQRVKQFGDVVCLCIVVVDVVHHEGDEVAAPLRLAAKLGQAILSGSGLTDLATIVGADIRLTSMISKVDED